MLGPFYILSAIFIWSSLGVFVRLSGVPLIELIFYSALVSVVLQGAIIYFGGEKLRLRRDRRLLFVVLLGPVTLLNIGSFFYAFRHTSIANAIMTHYIAPVVVAFLSRIFLKEKVTPRIFLSILIASAGLWIMLGADTGGFFASMSASDDAKGILAGLFSGVQYGVLIVLTRYFAPNFSPLSMCFLQNTAICTILFPFAGAPDPGALWSFIFMGVVYSTVAPILYFRGMKEVAANRAAVLGYLEPFLAIILGMAILGEFPPPVALAGGMLILLAGYVTIREG